MQGGATVDAFTAASAPDRLGRRVAIVDDDGTAYAAGIVLMLLGSVDEVELITPFETMFPHIGAGYDRPLLLERLGRAPRLPAPHRCSAWSGSSPVSSPCAMR